MKEIILSADDFGKSHARNMAIDYAIKQGIIKSAGLIMGSKFTKEAIDLAYGGGGYINNLHCHLNLISDSDNPFVALSDEFKNSKFCVNGQFKRYPKKIEYAEYTVAAYKELEEQYLTFRELTREDANYNHIDCHVYCNLVFPVAVAYKKLIGKYNVTSARYYGEHHKLDKTFKRKIKFLLIKVLDGGNGQPVKSCGIDYYLTKMDNFLSDATTELYVHPDYIGQVLMDNTTSVFGHKKVPLVEHIEKLKSTGDVKLISWEDFDKKK